MSILVVDASVAAKWFLPEEHTDAARRVLSPDHELHAPDCLFLEMDNVLRKRVRWGDLDEDAAAGARARLEQITIRIHPFIDLRDAAWSAAVQTAQSIYDCLYLALAALVGGQVVTADARFHRAVADGPLIDYVVWVGDLP